MNIAIVGSKNVKKLADVLYQSFDGISVLGYDDVNKFREAMIMRPLDFHRMILLEAAVSSEEVSTDDVYEFQEMILGNYPAMKIITISTDPQFTKFLAGLFNGRNYGHFCFSSLKGKILVDISSKDIPELYKIYKKQAYKEEVQSKEEILEGNKVVTEVPVENKEEIEGYIPPTVEQGKRSFLDKILGKGPKQAGKLTKDSGLQKIGQGTGITEFTNEAEGVDFSGQNSGTQDNEENMNIDGFEDPFANSDSEDFNDIDIFNVGDPVDLGLGNSVPENKPPIVFLDKEDENEEKKEENKDSNFGIIYRQPKEEEPIPFDINRLEKEEYVPVLNLEVPEVQENPEEPEEVNIDVPTVDLNSLKQTVAQTDFEISEDILNTPNLIDSLNLDVEDANVSGFDMDMNGLMSAYEDLNKPKVIEKEVIKVVEVNSGDSFRNKNGVRILILTGDRRIGCTKLGLNLANKYSKQEKVLFVDFDRVRHGSLGYLDLNDILQEEECIQNGVSHLKNLNTLKHVCHYYKKGNFYTLTSMYSEYPEDNQIKVAQEILAMQREYSTVIIDCPLENLYLLQTIVPFSKVLICAEDDRVGVLNLLSMLSTSFEEENETYNFFKESYFVVGRKNRIDVFTNELKDIVEMFGMDESMCDWRQVKVLGGMRDINSLIERMGK